ncbi:hypothetical protein, variant 1 [Spizellomyces punctatus DAOM BR117]|uniref:Uncharacterized protein n=2 Tax=Spizellomyces punctatus (strain DAOM BR117) TaxID=645134 RepID=A0A0L0HWC6_SPIPD|nr:hypothetical protein, variant 1 [Spizellomyces punctatus DAOM BR117]KND05189.1 hypothetical protein, variant 1 [Spizellomyces punctatus DAOM BR117]|eukprot:XP_016613228.1 hypothetical protein, variant 1 [Spizellomyces punctatus DAOM BR117]
MFTPFRRRDSDKAAASSEYLPGGLVGDATLRMVAAQNAMTSQPNSINVSKRETVEFVRRCLATTSSIPKGRRLDALVGLERLDENFHRYAFVRHLQRRIDAFISPALETHLRLTQDSAVASNLERVVPAVVEQIMTSPDYAALVAEVTDEAAATVTDILHSENTLNAIPARNEEPWQPRTSENRRASFDFSTQSNSTNDSTCGSLSLTHSPALDDIRTVTSNLLAHNSVDTRVAAIHRLASYPSADLLCGEFWKDTKEGLAIALSDADPRVVIVGLRVLARAFKAAPPHMTGDIYLCLVMHLKNAFTTGPHRKIADGLLIEDPKVKLTLRKFRLLNQFQKEITSCWIRYPESHIKDIMIATFQLLSPSLSPGKPSGTFPSAIIDATTDTSALYITPLHYLSILDTRASWFEKWMISQFGRSQVISAFVETGLLANFAAQFLGHAATLLHTASALAQASDEVLVMDVEATEDPDDLALRKKIIMDDIKYAHFLHVLVVLSKLSVFDGGRQCFPIRVEKGLLGSGGPALIGLLTDSTNAELEFGEGTSISLSIRGFTKILIKLMCHCSRAGLSVNGQEDIDKHQDVEGLKLSKFISRLLKDVTVIDKECDQRLFKNDILQELIEPLRLVTEGKKGTRLLEEGSLLDIAETLSNIVATDDGRRFVLQMEGGNVCSDNNADTSLPVHKNPNPTSLLEAVVALVKQTVSTAFSSPRFIKLVGAYVFFLRQLYRTCDGLRRLQQYKLHEVLAKTLEDAKWKNDQHADISMLRKEWSAIAVDNLLNFAGTPKGVLLLQLSGSMVPCVAYMFHRYEKKMQVSKCEKFGYGVLVSQISTTKPGMQALYATGLIRSFFSDLWAVLEYDGSLDTAIPHAEPLDDHITKKMIANLLKAFASFPGLIAILEAEHGKAMGKETLHYLMNCIILGKADNHAGDGPADVIEESHLIGLRILKLLTSSLDSFILLQSYFKFQESLLAMQRFAHTDGTSTCVIDEATLLRTHILVATYAVGGPEERILPPTQLHEALSRATCMVTQFPIPKQYMPDRTIQSVASLRACSELREAAFKLDTSPTDIALSDMQKTAWNLIRNGALSADYLGLGSVLLEIQRALKKLPESKRAAFGWNLLPNGIGPDGNVKVTCEVTECDIIGVRLATRYAMRYLPSKSEEAVHQDLTDLLQRCRSMLKSYRIPQPMLGSADTGFNGFDWFLSTMYILTDGNVSTVTEFAIGFLTFMPSMYVWPQRSYGCTPSTGDRVEIPLIYSTCCHLIEWILETELPSVFSAFTLSGCTPSQICQRWLRELFWNVLPLSEIANYVLLCMALGIDYQVYYCISLLRHNASHVLRATREQELITFLNEGHHVGALFSTGQYLMYMGDLEKKYRHIVLQEMTSAVGLH